jgi:myo-inositol-1(or 4)-monophosphatase
MSPHSGERKIMMRAAEVAAKSLMRDFARLSSLAISEKAPADFVSSADLAAQEILFAELSAAFPGHGFLLEEEAEPGATTRNARFIIGPLDGTTNFLHGIPHFSVSVALEVGAPGTSAF